MEKDLPTSGLKQFIKVENGNKNELTDVKL